MIGAAHIPALAATMLTLGACGLDATGQGERAFKQIAVQQTSATGFTVAIEALNVDGYALARCVAAAYTDAQRDDEGKRRYDIFVRDGGRLTDEFRLDGRVRNQRVIGTQTYRFATEGEHDGRDVMSVDLELAACERQDLPTKLGEG